MDPARYEKEMVDVAQATPREIAELVAFHNAFYGTSRSPAQWRWQYQSFRPHQAVVAVARSGGRIIGTQAAMPVPMRVHGRVVWAGKSENTLLHPSFRGSGVMEDLYEHMVAACLARGIRFLWGFTGAVKAFRRFGFQTHPVVETWSRPGWNVPAALLQRWRAPRPVLHRVLASGKVVLDGVRCAAQLLPQLVAQVRAPSEVPAADEIVAAGLDGDALAAWESSWEQPSGRGIAIHLGEGFLDWRATRHPFLRYDAYHHRAGGVADGYALLSQCGSEVSVAGWQGIGAPALSALLGHVVRAHQRRCSRLVLMTNGAAPDAPQRRTLLQRWGFSRSFLTHLVVRDLSGDLGPELAAPGDWRINGLWTEGYAM
jgi:GNAT superfamily N-acetyltransferase